MSSNGESHHQVVVQISSLLILNVCEKGMVKLLSGKYKGCIGNVAKFSEATNRPQVCRIVIRLVLMARAAAALRQNKSALM